jgi:GNAT superfamily N-acetyltransferase
MELPAIPMSVADYEVLEHPFGWKVEYWDGHARLSPRSIGVTTKINLTPRNSSHPYDLVSVTAEDRDRLISGYFESFSESVEFCGWPAQAIQESAERVIGNYFAAKRGQPLAASTIALVPGSQTFAGLALVIDRPNRGAFLDLLYVRPGFQRQGVATAMLHRAIDRLIEADFQTLTSRYHICNEDSRLWHHHHGFKDEYDWYYIKLKISWYRSEIWRREQLQLTDGLEELQRECDRWEAQLPEEFDLI